MFTHDTTRRALGSLALAVSLTLSACGGCDGGENNANDTNNTNNTNNAQCTVGEAGCACTSEGACTDGSVCTDGQCVGASASGLVVDAAEARSCEILLEEGSGELLDVTWGEGLEGAWTVDKLSAWLENPRAFAPGNRMGYPGLKDEADRAAVIAYLQSVAN